MSIALAMADAAFNCERSGAVAIVTLRSGVQLRGNLKRRSGADLGTFHMTFDDGGWATIAEDEIAAVEARPQ